MNGAAIAAGLIVGLLTGCATAPPAPTQAELESANHGPFPERWQENIVTYMAGHLRDPSSGQYDFFRVPTKTYIGSSAPFTYGWGTCAYVNAKNGFGGYTGKRISYFFMRDGQVLDSETSDGSEFMENIVRNRCAALPVPN